jgi:hypothetical protein
MDSCAINQNWLCNIVTAIYRHSFKREEEGKLLVERLLGWGRSVVHLFDQGLAGAFWLGLLLAFALRFVLRWRGD